MEIAENGAEAVEMARGGTFDLVLMDMQMPVMDGLEATRQIRALGSAGALPIVALTANAMKSDLEACLAAGMNDYVAKPIDRASLLAVLARNLAQARPIAGDAPAPVDTPDPSPAPEPATTAISREVVPDCASAWRAAARARRA